MGNRTFLRKLAATLLADYSGSLSALTIVLPSKRAKVFLLEAIRQESVTNLFAPRIVSIEDFIQDIAGLRSIDSTTLLFEFYHVYKSVTAESQQQSFDRYSNWAKTLLQDFNEIDRYLIPPMEILSYLKDIEDIKRWGMEVENKTQLIENYIDFWKRLPLYYDSLYTHLINQGKGYQGLIYREAVNNIEHFVNASLENTFIFAGFNALNAAEERIIQHLLIENRARIFWDIDAAFLEDECHDAGLFIRKFKKSWRYYDSHAFEWIAGDFSQPKNIEVVATPKTVGQAKIASMIIEELILNGSTMERTAIVLGEEHLLIPLLYFLPESVTALNITMGYSAKNNPVQVLISKLFRLHTSSMSRNASSYVMYYKDILDVLTHPLVQPFANAEHVVEIINRNNYTFITHHKVTGLNQNPSAFFSILFSKWDKGALSALETLTSILLVIKDKLNPDNDEDRIVKAFLFSVFQTLNKVSSYFQQNPAITDIDTLYEVYKQVIDLAEVSFEGEPLEGLQIMGVLESRVLDFDTVIITSMNEGRFPAGKSQNSFIPYDVKREKGLPTFKEKDAIYTYHFYHLLQRAKNVYLIYNTENDGLDGGERSRFITQLEVEKQPAHVITHKTYHPEIPDVAYTPISIEKSEKVMERLKEICSEGFSPSALTSYIRNPLDFYYRKILRIREAEEVEESIAVNTLGTIIHETLRALLEPFIGLSLTESHISATLRLIDEEVLKQFREVFKEGEIRKGRNLLAFEVAKRHVYNLLKMELKSISDGDEIKILALEKTYERILEHPSLPYPVKIRGNVDRIEMRNGKIRIIDYKSGRVEARSMVLSNWDGLMSDIKNDKIIQVLAYAFIFGGETDSNEIEAGIISFKNMKSGFLPFSLKEDKVGKTIIDEVFLENYIEQLALLLGEILDPEIPFVENID